MQTIIEDINAGTGYALVNKSDESVGYCCFVVGQEIYQPQKANILFGSSHRSHFYGRRLYIVNRRN